MQTAAATTGPTAYQQFLSPFQKDVIDTTLKEFDVQAAKGIPAIAAQAIGAGAFGGGREGVARAEFQQASDRNRAALQAQLLQQGFGQAQQASTTTFSKSIRISTSCTCIIWSTDFSVRCIRHTTTSTTTSSVKSAQQQLLHNKQTDH